MEYAVIYFCNTLSDSPETVFYWLSFDFPAGNTGLTVWLENVLIAFLGRVYDAPTGGEIGWAF